MALLVAALSLLLLARPRVERRGVADGGGGGDDACCDGRRAAVATLMARLLLAVVEAVGVLLLAKEAPRRRTKLLPRVMMMLLLMTLPTALRGWLFMGWWQGLDGLERSIRSVSTCCNKCAVSASRVCSVGLWSRWQSLGKKIVLDPAVRLSSARPPLAHCPLLYHFFTFPAVEGLCTQ